MSDNNKSNNNENKSVIKGGSMIQNGLKILKNMNNVNLLNVPLHAIIVPAGLTFAAWQTKKSSRYSQKGGGGDVLFSENPILTAWTNIRDISYLQPNTLLPLGILVLIYNIFDRAVKLPKKRVKNENKGKDNGTSKVSGGGDYNLESGSESDDESNITIGGGNMLLNHPLAGELMKVGEISSLLIRPSLMVPFALLMGRDVYKAYLMKSNRSKK